MKNIKNVKMIPVVYTGTDCINQMLDYIITFKGEPKKVNGRSS